MGGTDKKNIRILVIAFLFAIFTFSIIYIKTQIVIEKKPIEKESKLENWKVDDSVSNTLPIKEDKNIYVQDNQIYDVYLSVFPTKDKNGNILRFSDFSKHKSRDHSYNPVLNCNIQILKEDEKLDPLVSLEQKNATIRVRGNSSRGDKYKSYKVKMDENVNEFYGQNVLNINKHSEDVSKISTKLETDLLTDVDNITSYRTYFMRVWIRDASLEKAKQEFKYYGLYTEIEQPNKRYLELRGLSSNAVMYKARNFNFSIRDELKDITDPTYNENDFEQILQIREGNSHKKLLEMLKEINDPTADFNTVFHKYFNEENFLTWLAFNVLIGNEDIINHNYIIYSPNNSNTWYFIPWDLDGTLRFEEYKKIYVDTPISLRGIQKLNQNILCKRYLRMEGSLEKLQNKIQELLNQSFTKEKINTLIDGYMPVLDKTMMLEPDISLLYMQPNELPSYIKSLHQGMIGSYKEYLKSVDYPAPMYVDMPKKQKDSALLFSWESAYSYQGRPITYDVTVFNDYECKNKIWECHNLPKTTVVKKDGLKKGTYYLKVTAIDSEGNEQISLEHVEKIQENKAIYINGLLEFTID